MSDTIFVTNLALHAYHGVLPYEGKVGQVFKLDIALTLDLSTAASSDKLIDTINYGRLVEFVGEVFKARNYKLIEAAAGAVADALLEHYPRVEGARVTIHKPHAPIPAAFDDVGVTITRTRRT